MVLIRVFACGEVLSRRIGSDPDVLLGETSTFHDTGFRVRPGEGVLARDEFVPHRLAKPVLDSGIDDLPVAGGERINYLLCFGLSGEQRCFGEKGVAMRVLRAKRL